MADPALIPFKPRPGAGLTSIVTATCLPFGLISTRLPFWELAARMSPPGAMATPSGPWRAPFLVTVWPIPALR